MKQTNDLLSCRTENHFGIDIHALNMDEVVSICEENISRRGSLLLGVVNVAKIIKCRKNIKLRKSLTRADIVLADGLPIVWLSKLTGKPLPERVAGIDIMNQLIKCSSRKNYGIFLLGARQKVVEKVAKIIKTEYPGVRIAGFRNGYFSEEEEKEIAEEIKKSKADILFVAMSSPKKENFLDRWREYMNVPVCHGVGGSFDVITGVTKRAPVWMQKCGLEWFYRILQEPRRMWKRYLVTNTIFIALSLNAIASIYFGKLILWILPSRFYKPPEIMR